METKDLLVLGAFGGLIYFLTKGHQDIGKAILPIGTVSLPIPTPIQTTVAPTPILAGTHITGDVLVSSPIPVPGSIVNIQQYWASTPAPTVADYSAPDVTQSVQFYTDITKNQALLLYPCPKIGVSLSECGAIKIPKGSVKYFGLTVDKPYRNIQFYTNVHSAWYGPYMVISNIGHLSFADVYALAVSGSSINRKVGSPPWFSFSSGMQRVYLVNINTTPGDKFYITLAGIAGDTSKALLGWTGDNI